MPLSNNYLSQGTDQEPLFPLCAFVCKKCLLVQLGQFHAPEEIFSHYAYLSSYSDSWIAHGKRYVDQMLTKFCINPASFVIEIASNDGYLLQHFQAKKIPVLGIEPAKNVAQIALQKGIPTLLAFFGREVALQLQDRKGDLIIGNNVLAHVPDLHDFIAGLKLLLADKGVITLEFPHLLQLMKKNQFDTIYHEHFSYFSLLSLETIFHHHRLDLFNVEELETHGGSLRVYLQHAKGQHSRSSNIALLKEREIQYGLSQLQGYMNFSHQVAQVKEKLLSLLSQIERQKKRVVCYGAPAKGNTLLNYCSLSHKVIPLTVDRNPYKQGKFLPGTYIPIYPVEKIAEIKPDYLLILPWNLKEEIIEQLSYIRKWGGKFLIPIPEPTIQE